ncbi:MAG: RNA polymerase sigma factor RpoE [Burkholderiales bacterium]|jgi:RNA polymerase sigma-70 factor (ECF subfamily)|nr:RNA polymerase sigma factor RpoE [Burkholderiales bacterium]MCA3153649.1 RNA polymerase sigma factor RpoE [Burkholderiales bacterium]MCA3156601.1 RNA polymerase sigma factor RpoE [Burkholderiales bacterium]MCA3168137.1 RNA polymerase sigma factor RpoE [Burkholderiales bacterium]
MTYRHNKETDPESPPANVVSLLVPKRQDVRDNSPEFSPSSATAGSPDTVGAGAVLSTDTSGDRAIDQQLVERVQRGDKRAYELLVAKYQRKIHRLLSRLVRDAAEIEDITQEAFIKAYRALPQFRGESAFYTWLYRIAINTAKNHLVAQGRRVPTTTENNAEEAETFDAAEPLRDISTPESLLMSKQVAQTVNSAMLELPEELRTAITLREMEGLSYDEIAELMNCPIGTVRSRIFRAREAIAERLRPLLGTSKEKRW